MNKEDDGIEDLGRVLWMVCIALLLSLAFMYVVGR
jgi:hypothetical protein